MHARQPGCSRSPHPYSNLLLCRGGGGWGGRRRRQRRHDGVMGSWPAIWATSNPYIWEACTLARSSASAPPRPAEGPTKQSASQPVGLSHMRWVVWRQRWHALLPSVCQQGKRGLACAPAPCTPRPAAALYSALPSAVTLCTIMLHHICILLPSCPLNLFAPQVLL